MFERFQTSLSFLLSLSFQTRYSASNHIQMIALKEYLWNSLTIPANLDCENGFNSYFLIQVLSMHRFPNPIERILNMQVVNQRS